MFQLFHYCIGRKLNLILKLYKVATLNKQIIHLLHTVLLQILSAIFLPNIFLNWFSFHIVIMKVIGVNVFLKQCIIISRDSYN